MPRTVDTIVIWLSLIHIFQFVKDCLDEDDAVNIKRQRHTARRIYQRLVGERGFTGSESSVRNLVHDMRAVSYTHLDVYKRQVRE